MDRTTGVSDLESFVQSMNERITSLALTLGSWVQAEPRTLQEQEEQVVQQLHLLGSALLSGLLALAPQPTAQTLTCSCGAQASYRRHRTATVTTLLGRITYTRATYFCAACHQGHAPLDQQLHVAAGSISLGLQEVLSLLGATQASFPHAAAVLERLCLVQICPTTVRTVTEDLGSLLVRQTQQTATLAQQQDILPAAKPDVPRRLYVSMDGVVVHCRRSGWREIKTGCVYTTRALRARRHPPPHTLRMEHPSYGAALAEAESFGWQLYAEAARRGVLQAEEVIVIGDGAHWIWNLAELHFPGATQIVDWYHASQYLWNAGTAIHGDGTEARAEWVRQHLDGLWDGRLDEVLLALEAHAKLGGAVDEALSYYTSHRTRMDYPSYRARDLQIGSGTIESCCKHLISARLKQAGMIWSEAGANAVSAVRAWLKSGRWDEALALRPVPRRRKRREQVSETPSAGEAAPQERQVGVPISEVAPARLPAEVLVRVQSELAQERASHPWRKAWSIRQQRAQPAVQMREDSTTLTL